MMTATYYRPSTHRALMGAALLLLATVPIAIWSARTGDSPTPEKLISEYFELEVVSAPEYIFHTVVSVLCALAVIAGVCYLKDCRRSLILRIGREHLAFALPHGQGGARSWAYRQRYHVVPFADVVSIRTEPGNTLTVDTGQASYRLHPPTPEAAQTAVAAVDSWRSTPRPTADAGDGSAVTYPRRPAIYDRIEYQDQAFGGLVILGGAILWLRCLPLWTQTGPVARFLSDHDWSVVALIPLGLILSALIAWIPLRNVGHREAVLTITDDGVEIGQRHRYLVAEFAQITGVTFQRGQLSGLHVRAGRADLHVPLSRKDTGRLVAFKGVLDRRWQWWRARNELWGSPTDDHSTMARAIPPRYDVLPGYVLADEDTADLYTKLLTMTTDDGLTLTIVRCLGGIGPMSLREARAEFAKQLAHEGNSRVSIQRENTPFSASEEIELSSLEAHGGRGRAGAR